MSEPIANNVMRHEFRVLSDKEKEQMLHVKNMGLDMWSMMDDIANYGGSGSRELSLAKTKIEEAVMWATKHITR